VLPRLRQLGIVSPKLHTAGCRSPSRNPNYPTCWPSDRMPPRRSCQSRQTLFSKLRPGWGLAMFACCHPLAVVLLNTGIRRSSWECSCTFGQHSNLVPEINDLTNYGNLTESAHFAWKNTVTECCAQLKRPKAANMSIGTGSTEGQLSPYPADSCDGCSSFVPFTSYGDPSGNLRLLRNVAPEGLGNEIRPSPDRRHPKQHRSQ
jgi:hypothetical protein